MFVAHTYLAPWAANLTRFVQNFLNTPSRNSLETPDGSAGLGFTHNSTMQLVAIVQTDSCYI